MWTKKGQLFVIFGSFSLFGGLVFSNMIILILGFLLLAMVVISAMFKLGNEIAYLRKGPATTNKETYKGVKFKRIISSNQIIEGSNASVRLSIENPTGVTKRFELMDKAPDTVELNGGSNTTAITIPSRDKSSLNYQIGCPIKGFYKLGPIMVRETDICRFFYDEKQLKYTTDFKVFPNVFAIKELKLRSKIPKLYAGTTIINKPGQGMEFYSLRDYVPGDSYKDINWLAYAKTRKFMVNEHEMEAVIELTIILDYRALTKTGKVLNNPHLATARAAASLATFFINKRNKVGIAIYNGRVNYIHRESGSKHLNRLINYLTYQEVKGNMPLSATVNTLIHDIRKGMPVVVISNLEGDNTAYEGLKHLRALGCDVILISPSGISSELNKAKMENEREFMDLLTLAKIEREMKFKQIRSLGVKVVDWDIRNPFQNIIAMSLGGRWGF